MSVTPQDAPQTRTWIAEAKEALGWLEAHPMLLAALAIFLPTVGLYHYVVIGKVPLDIMSGDTISALPQLLAHISLWVILLSAMPILPVLAMFEGSYRDSTGLLRILPSSLKARRKKLIQWLIALSLPGLFLSTALLLTVEMDVPDRFVIVPAIVVSTVTFAYMSLRYRRGSHTKKWGFDAWYHALASGFFQIFLSITAMQLALMKSRDESDGLIFTILVLTAVALAVLQVLIVVIVESTSRNAGFFKQAMVGAVVAVSLLMIIPQSGSALTGVVLQMSASGGEKCLNLTLTPDADGFEKIIDTAAEDGKRTTNLKLLSGLGDVYIARQHEQDGRAVFRIPKDKVTGMQPCSKSRDAKPEAAGNNAAAA